MSHSNLPISASVGAKGTNNAADVRIIQQGLARLGHAVATDGQMNEATTAAIHAFQQGVFKGWSDGTIEPGRNTWKSLCKCTAAAPPMDHRLRATVGHKGTNNKPDVAHVQALLTKAQLNTAVDGLIGRNTIRGIEQVQQRLGISPPTGLLEPDSPAYQALLAGTVPPPPEPSGKYFTHPGANAVRLSYGSNALPLNVDAEHLLKSVLAASGNSSATVTSSYRSYYHQARVMIQYYSVTEMQRLYARGKDFAALRRQANDDIHEFARLLEADDKKNNRLVSLHVTGFAIDVVPGQDRVAYAQKMKALKAVEGSGIHRFLPLGTAGEKVDHVEFTFRVV